MFRSFSILLLLLCSLALRPANAQDLSEELEDITIGFSVPGVGTIVLPALIDYEPAVYLPVAEVFAFIRLKVESVPESLVLAGYILNEEKRFTIDGTMRSVDFDGASRQLKKDEIIVYEGRVYLRSDLYGEIFGLHCNFNFRDLVINLVTDYELPAVRDAKRERARRALKNLDAPVHFDRRVESRGDIIQPGMIDWSLGALRDTAGRPVLSYAVDFGGELLGGALTGTLKGKNDSVALAGTFPLQWKYVDNDFAPARQIILGSVPVSLPEPVRGQAAGIHLTNRSTINRTVYGTWVIEDRTEPNWTVELYVDNNLVDFTEADEAGQYRFTIPLRYGATSVVLKFYGPWGEERSLEKEVRVPFVFLPQGEVEYGLTAGVLDDGETRLFARAGGEAGLMNGLTLGGGVLAVQASSTLGESFHPFANGSLRLADNLFLSGEVFPTLGGNATLNWNVSGAFNMEAEYRRETQDAGTGEKDIVERRALGLSAPVSLGLVRGNAMMRVVNSVSRAGVIYEADATYTTRLFGLPVTLSGRAGWSGRDSLRATMMETGIRTTLRPFRMTSIRPSVEFDWRVRRATNLRVELEQKVFDGLWLGGTVVRDLIASQTTVQAGLRLDLSFARASFSASRDARGTMIGAGAGGSIAWDTDAGRLLAERRSSLDKGALTLRPFLDLNGNDVRDADEPLVPDIGLAVPGGSLRRCADSTIRVLNLIPHRPYILTVNEAGLPDISWKAKYHTWEVTARPNRFQTIDIPVVVVGEINGRVYRKQDGKGMAGLIVRFEQTDGDFRDSTITFDDGEYFYLGLPPGHYAVSLDEEQSRVLGLEPEQSRFEFEVRAGREGDFIDGVDFLLK